ncbi:AAA family ATPase [Asticcacaulis sp. EMRT-3]|uniref:AAA family ATPase n=1 Tax=Asticcacaulis sp. EMRT-3 TaxID=3040349 RepID=UPI0024AEBE31|nr:AAA family ATPase [Asticcacaulis sp. EMRT-3]MDI7775268.1 zeta toxin family protein [Asticcacaulis sp. EMRT-3]
MLPASLPQPELWIIAGPNGSGKSSAYGLLTMDSPKNSVWIINPDILAKRIADSEALELDPANLLAVQRIEAWLYASVEAYQTVGVETVLSSPKYRRLVEMARERGFQINLIYVYLKTVELNIERVRLRIKRGGHDVPEDKIRARRSRSFEQLAWFFDMADKAYIFDNSEADPKLIASKTDDGFSVDSSAIAEIMDAVLASAPELKDLLERPADGFQKL